MLSQLLSGGPSCGVLWRGISVHFFATLAARNWNMCSTCLVNFSDRASWPSSRRHKPPEANSEKMLRAHPSACGPIDFPRAAPQKYPIQAVHLRADLRLDAVRAVDGAEAEGVVLARRQVRPRRDPADGERVPVHPHQRRQVLVWKRCLGPRLGRSGFGLPGSAREGAFPRRQTRRP